MKMILERYYKHIKNYQQDEGEAFMTNVYGKQLDKEKEYLGVPDA